MPAGMVPERSAVMDLRNDTRDVRQIDERPIRKGRTRRQ
jgi:hypothetical protein